MRRTPSLLSTLRYSIQGCCSVFWFAVCLAPLSSTHHPVAVRPANFVDEASTPDSAAALVSSDPARQRALHLARLGVTRWHGAGFAGKGLKIAILDSGFRGYRWHLGKALPMQVTVRSFRKDGNLEAKNSQHGILCSEVVHAIAPEAELLFANWDPDRPDEFLQAVAWARAQGARILSCSLIMPSWSDGEGGGTTHAALAELIGKGGKTGDMLCFASAGNTAQRHWNGEFKGSAGGLHEWRTGQECNELFPWGDEQVSVELCAHETASYELIVADDSTRAIVARCQAYAVAGQCRAIARFQPSTTHVYSVHVRLSQGPGGSFHLVALGAGLQYATARGSIPFPADGQSVIAVGAVDQGGRRTAYSSCGPNSHRPKPDLVAPVPFPSVWRSQPFSGTSAAAPQAAALAALLWQKNPKWTATQVWDAIRKSAQDLGPPGHDYETGYGLICLP